MASKIAVVICIQMALFNVITGQCLNRVLPGLAPGLPGFQGLAGNILPVAETILPNQVVFSPGYPGAPVIDVPYQQYGLDIVPNQVLPATTIIQDSTVANNLANALQLLVVSNLLSNTLPSMNDVIVPAYPSVDYGVIPSGVIAPGPCSYGGYNAPYNYVY